MKVIDDRIGARAFQAMVAMRDGTRLNTFVFLPGTGGPRWPVILHRTPYGITAADASDKTDCTRAWLPSPEEPLPRFDPTGMAQYRHAWLCRGLSGHPRPPWVRGRGSGVCR